MRPSGWRRWVSEDADTTPQPPPLKRRGGSNARPKAPSSLEEGVGGGGGATPLRARLLKLAAELRKNPPEPERRVWNALRRSDLAGFKFRRQAVIGARIVDFFCPAKGLVVEIDGDTHHPATDAARDEAMRTMFGFVTLRFTNDDVMRNLEGVLLCLLSALEREPDRWNGAATTPQPPPLKRRGIVAEALREASARLDATSDTARLDAEVLMAEALGTSRSDMLLWRMDAAVPEGFAALVERRARHEPVAYILGRKEFFGREFAVAPGVLIPRMDSEATVAAALEACPHPRRVLDCGVGSGALLLTVLAEAGGEGVGIDRSEDALAIAARNARAHGLAVTLLARDWGEPGWAGELGDFDLILANPPYVEDDAPLAPDVRRWEPEGALFAGPDGLDDYRLLIPQLPALLAPGGVAIFEIGASQADAVTQIAAESGFSAALRCDLGGRPRALVLRRTGD